MDELIALADDGFTIAGYINVRPGGSPRITVKAERGDQRLRGWSRTTLADAVADPWHRAAADPVTRPGDKRPETAPADSAKGD